MKTCMDEIIALPVVEDHTAIIGHTEVYEEPVEILVKLAQEGEIDPWNIDIVEVTDKFLQHIEQMERLDLRISGRTLLYAAILLRMKSNILVEAPSEEIDSWVDDFEFLDVEEYPIPKPPVRRHSNRPVTLNELIVELEKAEVVEQRRAIRKHTREVKEFTRPTTEQVLGIAHEEDIEGNIRKMRETLKLSLKDKNYITLSELIDGDRHNKLMTYISLLFLANMKEIWLEQKEIFGELYIKYPGMAGEYA